ncbi:hypothetical protein BKD30_05610 [Tersicoccus phoenicis]|uniref:FAD-binding oxidoreductase n=1 Tax=Tersicoccus phoenicis TaxID=554083 RepID=A0A1R1LEX0_9MICC|nr:FAD-linked oxidase C-terminal domain-containing protein [Tersicoccus phoenicis]OMH26045.1 hypothetical protein BKD30_05610 [Tersicoccus phoenicis]
MRALIDEYGDAVRRRYPPIPRRVSGYNLDSLLPEKQFHVAQALVGTESTCVLVLRAKLTLMPVVNHYGVVLLGCPDAGASGDDVPAVVAHDPLALEGFDAKVIEDERANRMNATAIEQLPAGPQAWLLVQFGGDSVQEAQVAARAFAQDARGFASEPTVTVLTDPQEQGQLWEVREAALGAVAQVPGLPAMWPGWEDSAVAPERMGDYLRALRRLYTEFRYDDAAVYGHYGQGCVHSRVPFDLVTADGVARFRAFLERAARLVVSMGGSLSGEHGDGQARAELLPIMYGDDLVDAFARFKAIFDPDNRMNPGKLAAPYRIDENLRLGPGYAPRTMDTHFAFPRDDGDFGRAALRCVGVGKCRRNEGGVMCPSYMVTREEEHSTRGRARVLFEMLQGHPDSPIQDGWRSTAVRDALDLCLACKGCKQDCPVNVDMATFKAELLSHHYAGRLRPLSHYSMGWLPVWAQLASRLPTVVNAVTAAPGLSRLALRLAGAAPQRQIPRFAEQSFTAWYRERNHHEEHSRDAHGRGGHRREAQGQGNRGGGGRGEVVLWPDTFTNVFHPHIAQAAVEVLEDAGWRVVVPEQAVCCRLTWISTGQLDIAKRVLRRTVAVLRPYLRNGTLILGLEPSCTAVFRADAVHGQQLGQGDGLHLAELLAAALHTDPDEPARARPEAAWAPRPHTSRAAGWAALSAVVLGTAAVVGSARVVGTARRSLASTSPSRMRR